MAPRIDGRAAALAAAAFLICLPAAAGSPLTLAFSGSPGTRFAGECTLHADGNTEVLTFDDPVPLTRRLSGDALQCRISADGRLTVEVRKGDNNISRSTTSGGTIAISVN